MNASTLCTLIAQRIDPKQFWLSGLEIVWLMETRLPPIEGETSPYDTPENRAIVKDVIKNYNKLAAELLASDTEDDEEYEVNDAYYPAGKKPELEALIQAKIREQAIAELQKEGKL